MLTNQSNSDYNELRLKSHEVNDLSAQIVSLENFKSIQERIDALHTLKENKWKEINSLLENLSTGESHE